MPGLTADGGPVAPLRGTVLADLGQAVAAIAPEDGVILWANAACERLFGYDAGGLEGHHLSEISAASVHSPGARAAAIEHELARSRVWSGATEGLCRDGATFPCIASVSEIDDDETGQHVWAAVFLAAGQAEGAEERSLAVRRLTELVFEGASAAMAVVGTDLRVAEGNRAFLELTGHSYHEVVGQPVSGVIHPDHVAPFLDRLHALFAEEADFVQGESRLSGGDRHEIPVCLSAALVRDLDRRPLYALLFLEARGEP